jgi:hypothetical protein
LDPIGQLHSCTFVAQGGANQLKKDESGKKAAQLSSRHGNLSFANANLKDGKKKTDTLIYPIWNPVS